MSRQGGRVVGLYCWVGQGLAKATHGSGTVGWTSPHRRHLWPEHGCVRDELCSRVLTCLPCQLVQTELAQCALHAVCAP